MPPFYISPVRFQTSPHVNNGSKPPTSKPTNSATPTPPSFLKSDESLEKSFELLKGKGEISVDETNRKSEPSPSEFQWESLFSQEGDQLSFWSYGDFRNLMKAPLTKLTISQLANSETSIPPIEFIRPVTFWEKSIPIPKGIFNFRPYYMLRSLDEYKSDVLEFTPPDTIGVSFSFR